MRRRPVLVLAALLLATCREDRQAFAPAPAFALAGPAQTVLLVAGDVATCSNTYSAATAALLDTLTGYVVVPGDAAAPAGASTDYASCYNPTWGRQLSRTYPVPGDLDYATAGAAGYLGYFAGQLGQFAPTANDAARGYYSADLGDWHIIALNSQVSMAAGSPQEQWLKADLAAHPKECTLAYWHLPAFYSGTSTERTSALPLWADLYAAGAELVLNAHTRNYERFAPQTPAGALDTAFGIREFIVGTGGLGRWGFGSIAPNSEVRYQALGVLKLTLYANGYTWQFVPVAGESYADSGTALCHGTPGSQPPPPPPPPADSNPVVDAGFNLRGSPGTPVTLAFRVLDSNEPGGEGAWTYSIDWGDGSATDASLAAVAVPNTLTHTYAASGAFHVHVTVRDSDGGVGLDTLIAFIDPPGTPQVFVGAGDIGSCVQVHDDNTARILDTVPGTVFVLGDNAYPDGSDSAYTNCFGASWGRHRKRIRPISGNHDYYQPGAEGYFHYFGVAAGDTTKGYYSYDLGSWHIVALNSTLDVSPGSPEEQWLRSDLAAHPAACTLAYFHIPRFSSGLVHGSSTKVQPLWQALYDYGADVVLSGHEHNYERFAPQAPDATLDSARGIREFVVGTGGSGYYNLGTPIPNSEVSSTAHGVLKLTLGTGGYGWRFIAEAGTAFADTGSATCH